MLFRLQRYCNFRSSQHFYHKILKSRDRRPGMGAWATADMRGSARPRGGLSALSVRSGATRKLSAAGSVCLRNEGTPRHDAQALRTTVRQADHVGLDLFGSFSIDGKRNKRKHPKGAKQSLPSLSNGFKSNNRCSHRHIERIGNPIHRDDDILVGGVHPSLRDACGFGAHH